MKRSRYFGLEAMGGWEATWMRVGIYNEEFYKRATKETGCRAYYPEGVSANDATRGKGCWRLVPYVKIRRLIQVSHGV